MRLHMGLVLIGIASAACSQPGNEPSDLGNGPNDASAVDGPVGAGQILSLIAGGLGGPGNVDDIGAAARWNSPEAVAADGAGNLYVVDTNNCTIRKVVISTGLTTTIAGTARMPGIVDGIGAAARFYYPRAVASDGAGNLYVADTEGQIIRKVVVSTGAVTTLAGTPARERGLPSNTSPPISRSVETPPLETQGLIFPQPLDGTVALRKTRAAVVDGGLGSSRS